MICRHENSEIILETKGYKLYKCSLCELIFVCKDKQKKINSGEVYDNYYKKETAGRFGAIIELVVKLFRFMRAYKIFILMPKAKSILDIGSGRGWMLYFMKKKFKYKITAGTQISENAYRFSKEKLKLEIYNYEF